MWSQGTSPAGVWGGVCQAKRAIKAKVTSRDSAEASEATSDTNKTCTEEEGIRGRSQFRGFFREHSAGVTLPPSPEPLRDTQREGQPAVGQQDLLAVKSNLGGKARV